MASKQVEIYVDDELWIFDVSDKEFQKAQTGNVELLQFLMAREREKRSMVVRNEELEMMNEELEADEPRTLAPQANEVRKESFIWLDQAVLLFLEIYRNKEPNFASGLKRHNKIWEEIANEMKEAEYNVTAAQCQNKVSGLKSDFRVSWNNPFYIISQLFYLRTFTPRLIHHQYDV